MRSTSRVFQLGLLITVTIAVAGCSLFQKTKTSNVYQTDLYSEETAAAYGSLICGVVSTDPDRLALESSPEELSSMLYLSLLEDKPSIKLLGFGSLKARAGPEGYQEILSSLETLGGPSPEQWLDIQEWFKDSVVYLICGRLEEDFVSTHTRDNNQQVDGNMVTVGTDYVTKRTTSMRFTVYHLASAEVAWHGQFRRKESNEATYMHDADDDDDDGGIIGALVSSLLDDLLGTGDSGVSRRFPNPPGLQQQARKIYKEFAADVLHED